MRAVDTNILVRAVTQDDPVQTEIAARILRQGVFVPTTVLLETAWVLARSYRQNRIEIADTVTRLLDLSTVYVTAEPALRHALDLFRAGADFADAVHLVAAEGSEAFVTFDRKLARLADAPIAIELAN